MTNLPRPRSPVDSQTALPHFAGGVRLNLLDASWFQRLEVEPAAEVDAESCRLAELQEIAARLQLTLGEKPNQRQCPPVEDLDALERDLSRKQYVEHPAGLEHVGELDDPDLNDRLCGIHKRLARGLSKLDLAVIREWKARATGFGFFYGRQDPYLPTQFVHLAGRRAPTRQTILAAMFLAMDHGTNSLNISAPEAERLWGIPSSTWWHAHAWLEAEGLFTRFHSHKPNEKAQKAHHASGKGGKGPAPVQFSENCYIPTPKLLAMRPAILAAMNRSGSEANEIARRVLIEERKARARKQRGRVRDRKRRERGELPFMVCGEDAPPWVFALIDAAWLTATDNRNHDRAIGILYGWEPIPDFGADPLPPQALEPDQLAELERLAGEHPTPAQLESIAREAPDPPLEHPEPAKIRQTAGGQLEYGPGVLPPLSRGATGSPPGAWSVGDLLPAEPGSSRVAGGRSPAAGAEPVSHRAPPSAPQLPSNHGSPLPVGNRTELKWARGETGSAPAAGDRPPATRLEPDRERPQDRPSRCPADRWARQDWANQTTHHDPLARWAEAREQDNAPAASAPDGARALPQGASRAPPRSTRDRASAELRRTLERSTFANANPETAAAILETIERFERTKKPPR